MATEVRCREHYQGEYRCAVELLDRGDITYVCSDDADEVARTEFAKRNKLRRETSFRERMRAVLLWSR